MSENKRRTCKACRSLDRHPMLMITPGPITNSNPAKDSEKVLLAARLKCTCYNDMRIEYGSNAADLSHLKPEIREIIYDTIMNNRRYIPLIDSEMINSCNCISFITNINKKHFKSWAALDLLTVDQFEDYIKKEIIAIEKIKV